MKDRRPDPFAPTDPRILWEIKRWNKRLSQRGLSIKRGAGALTKIAANKKKRAVDMVLRHGRFTNDVTIHIQKNPVEATTTSAQRQPKSDHGVARADNCSRS